METVAFYCLGCKVNQYEAEAMAELFRRAGYRVVDFSEAADVYVVHTCTVTTGGASKSRNIIRRARRRNPEAVLAVTGCYPQVEPEAIRAIEGVDVMVGTQDRADIVRRVEQAGEQDELLDCVRELPRNAEFEPLRVDHPRERTRGIVKIQEGCDRWCSYCVIPRARGPVRSRPEHEVLDEVRRLHQSGFKEVVLTGINLGAYGRDLETGINVARLLEQLLDKTAVPRVRLSSVEPDEIDAQLLEAVTCDRICNHLHIPLQHGHNEILRRMQRRYSVEEYKRIISRLRERQPEMGITTDIMVGFPGEKEHHFAATLDTAAELAFSGIHVFKYSPRPGTKAASLSGRVAPEVASRRSERLRQLARDLALEFHSRFEGRDLEVLVEDRYNQQLLRGTSGNYIRVLLADDESLVNELVAVRVEQVYETHVEGSPVQGSGGAETK